MKKTLSSILAFLFLVSMINAQETAAKGAKSASKALASYFLDTKGNAAKLQEAKQKIDEAGALPDAETTHAYWQTRGEVYGALTQQDLLPRMVNPNAPIGNDVNALEAFKAFKKAYQLAEKKFQKTDAIKGIKENLQSAMINIGADKYQSKEYEKAYANFLGAVEAHKLLKENKEPSLLDDPKQYNDYVYYAGYTAAQAGMHKEALETLDELYKSGSAAPDVYLTIYECKMALKDEEGAKKLLEDARKRHPEDPGLLFAEINAYLAAGKLDELTGRLQQAIEKEPSNVSLYLTLGNVYDNLYQKALEAKDDAAAKTNFEMAMKNYQNAIELDPKNVDAIYSTGALYYNKAAIITKMMNELDVLKNDQRKKYEALEKESKELFAQALPYFKKAESLNPNDVNTLIALKEILTRQEDDMALEVKKRLDKVQEGGKNETSLFKM